jgi:hypothetical protein
MIARKEAGKAGINSIDTEHLLIGTCCLHPELLVQLGIDLQLGLIRSRSEHWHTPSGLIPDPVELPISPDLGKVFERPYRWLTSRGAEKSARNVYSCRCSRSQDMHPSYLQIPAL